MHSPQRARPDSEDALHLFVYGTLMLSGVQGGLLASLSRRPGTTRGSLYHLRAGYPALCLEGDDRIHGELVDPPSSRLLGAIDVYEGVAEGLYQRKRITVRTARQSVVAWAYVMQHPKQHGGRRIASGKWRGFSRR